MARRRPVPSNFSAVLRPEPHIPNRGVRLFRFVSMMLQDLERSEVQHAYQMRQCEHKPNPYTFIDGDVIWWLCWACHLERTRQWKPAIDRSVAEAQGK